MVLLEERDCNYVTACMQQHIAVNRISVARLDKLWEQQAKADFLECAQEEQLGLSEIIISWSRSQNLLHW